MEDDKNVCKCSPFLEMYAPMAKSLEEFGSGRPSGYSMSTARVYLIGISAAPTSVPQDFAVSHQLKFERDISTGI